MKVRAKPGTRCPKEDNPRDYIDDLTTQEVPETAYYGRLVNDGSLIVCVESQKKKGGK